MNSNNINTTNTKSTQELKNQVLGDIKKVREDFEEIKNRMTPGQLIDDAIFFRSGRNGPAATFEYLKNNPVGTSFLTLGTLLLMEDKNHLSYEQMVKDKASSVKGKIDDVVMQSKNKVDQVKGSIQSKFPKKGESTSQAPDQLLDVSGSKIQGSAEQFKETAQQRFEGAKSSIGSAKESAQQGFESAKSSFDSAKESLKSKSHDAYQTVKNLDPMTYLALGAGLGTITGAALPVLEAERKAIDQKFEDKMTQFRTELESALNQSVNILKNEFIGDITNINMKIF